MPKDFPNLDLSSPFLSRSPEDTRNFARRLVATLGRRAVLALKGDLGAGKTCFVRGLAEGLRIEGDVTSPTYTLIHEYEGGLSPLVHMDLYRISGDNEAVGLGLEDYLDQPEGYLAIEWPDRAASSLPPGTVEVTLTPGISPQDRLITVRVLEASE